MTIHYGIQYHVYEKTNDDLKTFDELNTEHSTHICALSEIIEDVITDDNIYVMTYNQLYSVFSENPINTEKTCLYSFLMTKFPLDKEKYKIAFKKCIWW